MCVYIYIYIYIYVYIERERERERSIHHTLYTVPGPRTLQRRASPGAVRRLPGRRLRHYGRKPWNNHRRLKLHVKLYAVADE